ncbi:hypothetical protein [Psychroserpens mesophilus]|uniref:hypothetical protein n=1 Tax=Psychroserpens mesophilus TaxID=325473 RepID=UPI003D656ACC
MKNIVLVFSLLLLCSFNASSQDEQINVEAINNYKYVIIPLKYDFVNAEDKYQINSLTKFLFNKYGYTAFLENDSFPEDLVNNRCLALTADVVKVKGGFLNTRLRIDLMDCKNNLVISSKMGKTREKEYKVAYNLALRDAFETFQFFNYEYKPNEIVAILSSNDEAAQKEIERLKEEVATLKEDKAVKQNVIKAVVETPQEKVGEQNEIKAIVKTPSENLKDTTEILYAQPINEGYQLVDQTTKVVMVLLKTPKANMFMVKGQNAMVYKEEGLWYISKNDGKSTSIEVINIKF